jgi:hypothetical protein
MTASANPRYRLAPSTSSQKPVPSICNGFKTTFQGIPEPLDRRRTMQLLTAFHHHRRRWRPTKHFANHQTPFNIHNPHLDHRDRAACGSLLTS